MEINEGQIPVAKDREILGDEKRELEKVRFKTGINSASPNANLHEESSTPVREIKGQTMQQKGLSTKRRIG